MLSTSPRAESKGAEHVEHVEQVDYTNPHNCREFVFLPLTLTKKFDVGKLWVGDNSFIIRDSSSNTTSATLVVVWAMDASIMGVVHGDDSPLRNDIIAQRSKVMDTAASGTGNGSAAGTIGALNLLYHSQLKDFLSWRKIGNTRVIEPLPPVTIDDEEDESGGCVPQLRADMVLMVPIGDSVGSDLVQGRAKLIARDRKDMHSWMRNNVIAVAREDLEQLTGPLPHHFDESSAEFATWLDTHFARAETTIDDTPIESDYSWSLYHNGGNNGADHDNGDSGERMIFQSIAL